MHKRIFIIHMQSLKENWYWKNWLIIFLSVIQRLIIFLSVIQRLIIFLSAIQRRRCWYMAMALVHDITFSPDTVRL